MSDPVLELLADPDAPPMTIDRAVVVAGGRRRARRRHLAQATCLGAGVAALAVAYAVLPPASTGDLDPAAPGVAASATMPHPTLPTAQPSSRSLPATKAPANTTPSNTTTAAGCPVLDTLTASRAWDLGDGRSARLRVLISECGASARLASPGLGGYLVGALPDQPVQDGLPTKAFAGVVPLADRDGGGVGQLPIIVAPRDRLPAGVTEVVDLGHGWAAGIAALTAVGKTPTIEGSSLPILPGQVIGTAGPEVDYPDISSTETFPFTVDGQEVNVTVSVGTADVAPGAIDHIVVNPSGTDPDTVELGTSLAVFTPDRRGPAIWAAQSAPAGTTAPWVILGVASAGIDKLRIDTGGATELVTARPLGDTGYVVYLTSARGPLTDSVQPPVLTPVG